MTEFLTHETQRPTQEVYYHYTSLDALYAIVQSRTFRLMSLKSSNDRTELFYKPTNFVEDITRLCETEEDGNAKRYYALVKASFESHKDRLMNDLKSTRHPYALCLATKKDNLTHWDRYAGNCTGVAIGLNVKALDVLYRSTEASGFALGLLDLGHTLYTQDSIDSRIKFELFQGLKWLKELNKTTAEKDLRRTIEQSGYLFLGAAYRSIMKFVKTQAFLDEDEYRIYFDPCNVKDVHHLINTGKRVIDETLYKEIRENLLSLVDCLKIEKEQFAMTKAGIRGYHNLCFDRIWGSLVIPEIVLGPMCVQNKNELQRFLKANGLYETKISISKVPIR